MAPGNESPDGDRFDPERLCRVRDLESDLVGLLVLRGGRGLAPDWCLCGFHESNTRSHTPARAKEPLEKENLQFLAPRPLLFQIHAETIENLKDAPAAEFDSLLSKDFFDGRNAGRLRNHSKPFQP